MNATRTPAPAPVIPEPLYTITMTQSEAMLLSDLFLLNVSIPALVSESGTLVGRADAAKVKALMSDVRVAIACAQTVRP